MLQSKIGEQIIFLYGFGDLITIMLYVIIIVILTAAMVNKFVFNFSTKKLHRYEWAHAHVITNYVCVTIIG